MPAAAIVAGSVIGAGASIYGANKAAGAAEKGAKMSIAEQRRQFDLIRADTAKTRALGDATIGRLTRLQGLDGQPADPSLFTADPGYQFNVAETMKAVDRRNAAGGKFLGGAGVREAARYASGLASQGYGDYFNRLLAQAGLGQTAVGQSAAAGMNAANNIGAAYQNAGNARASAYMGAAQGINNSIQGGLQNWLLQKYLGAPA